MNGQDFINSVVLTAVVFAALVTSVTDIVISIINNRKLKAIENQKHISEIDKYRYSRLYELIEKWHDYDSEYNGESPEEIAFHRMLNLFMDDSGRYSIAKPLLDDNYVKELDAKQDKGERLLQALVSTESSDNTHSKEFMDIQQNYFSTGTEFSELLKTSINNQLRTLLNKNAK